MICDGLVDQSKGEAKEWLRKFAWRSRRHA